MDVFIVIGFERHLSGWIRAPRWRTHQSGATRWMRSFALVHRCDAQILKRRFLCCRASGGYKEHQSTSKVGMRIA
ncbi:hypothetical protein DBV39_04800 [Orrella marina]|uniref:Uncharacterized protein n=1 Tax=Orrella marina TaxID=2163011 RepID=A0A2R4XH71_9BURK|nr:hypothetical protein DBV39_04800 [Orrella marina]